MRQSPRTLCLTACLLLLLSGCSALPVPIDVHMKDETTVERGTAVEQLLGGMEFSNYTALDVSQSEELQNLYLGKNAILTARVKLLELSVLNPPEQDFDFIEDMSFYVSAEGQPRQRIAHRAVPRDSRYFRFELDPVDLAPYIRAESMTITTETKARRPVQDTRVGSRLVITVGVGMF